MDVYENSFRNKSTLWKLYFRYSDTCYQTGVYSAIDMQLVIDEVLFPFCSALTKKKKNSLGSLKINDHMIN